MSPAVRRALADAKAALGRHDRRARAGLVGRWRLVDTGHVFIVKRLTPEGLALVSSGAQCWHLAVVDLIALRERGALQYLGR